MFVTKQIEVPLWHYVCPECGVSDRDSGYHAPTHMLYCEVCLEDGRQTKLKRWQVEESITPGAEQPP